MNEEKGQTAVEASFTRYLAQQHLRKTPERMVILSKAVEQSGPFVASALLGAVEATGFHISRATLYNTLSLLVEARIIRPCASSQGVMCYERVVSSATVTLRHTTVCDRCGKVREVRDALLQRVLLQRRYPRFSPSGFTLQVSGLCSTCQRQMNAKQKKRK